MRRAPLLFGVLIGLLLGGHSAYAASNQQRLLLLTGNNCGGASLSLDFVNGAYCTTKARVNSFQAIPEAIFTRASAKTCQTVAQALAGTWTTVVAGVPCATDLGILIEEARTNSFLNSAVGVTQSVTTTTASWTLSLYGTGSITMSGTCSGTLNGTEAANRVNLTVTATAGSCVLTVSGSVTQVQFEAGTFPTSYILTTSSVATRAADVANILFGLASPFTLIASGIVPPISVTRSAYFPRIVGNSADGSGPLGFAPSGYGFSYDLSVELDSPNTISAGSIFKLGVSQRVGLRQISLNGSTVATSASANISQTAIAIGKDVTGDYANTYIAKVAVYAYSASASQLQAMTQ